MSTKLHILQHALGVDQYGEGGQYRNRYVTGPGSDSYANCRELVADGLMVERAANEITGGDNCFHVTPKGVEFVAVNSPARPKVSRGKARYRAWLQADTGRSFANWIGVEK